MRDIPSYQQLGVQLNAITESKLYEIIAETVEADRRCVIGHHNLHSVYLYHHDDKMRTFYERAHYIMSDSYPLIYIGMLFGHPLHLTHRLACWDYVLALMDQATRRGWRVFWLGSKPGEAALGAEILRERFPGLQIATAHGYFSMNSKENQEILETINAFRPNLLMVGMGMPRQEHWILNNLENVHANVLMTVGACMNYIAGTWPMPSRWMGPLLLQGKFRLLMDFPNVWRRFLLEPWFILWLALRELVSRIRALK